MIHIVSIKTLWKKYLSDGFTFETLSLITGIDESLLEKVSFDETGNKIFFDQKMDSKLETKVYKYLYAMYYPFEIAREDLMKYIVDELVTNYKISKNSINQYLLTCNQNADLENRFHSLIHLYVCIHNAKKIEE